MLRRWLGLNEDVATQCSFDITSNVDLQEVDNALNQARKEVAQRYDFKGAKASIDFDPKDSKLVLVADDEFKLNALWEVVQTRLIRRNVPVKNLTRGPMQPAANSTTRQEITLQQGIPTEKARDIVKFLKDAKLKRVQAAIQGDQLRVSSPSNDDLQEAMRTLEWRCSSGIIGDSYFLFFSSQLTSISLPPSSWRMAFEIRSVGTSNGSSAWYVSSLGPVLRSS